MIRNDGTCGVVVKSTPQTNDAYKNNNYVHICTINYLNFLWSWF